MVDAAGRRMQHGSRQHACWTVERYREYVGKIVTELGRRFGHNPAVWGWQLDNEPSHYGKEPCYCDACQAKFRGWLEKKYGSIEALNRDWGTSFWSERYSRFDQIRLPNQQELVATPNPHALLDMRRWFSAESADYLRFQTRILRQYCEPRQWVTTNYMHNFAAINPAEMANDFELITWTHYPAHGELNQGPLGFRLGSASDISFYHDFMRSINGFHGIMELQPGQVNWGQVNPQPYPGAVHLWIMRAFAAGSKLACTYRYREPLSGSEMYHYGLVGTDGVTPTNGGEQYSQAAHEVQMLRQHATPGAAMPAAYAARRTAVLYTVENRWDIDNHKQTTRWDTTEHFRKYYRALKSAGCPVDVITEDKDFSIYPFLIAPAYQLVDDKLVQRWKDYVEKGGHLILTCRAGEKDRRGFLHEGPWAAPILDLIGAKIKFYDVLPAPYVGKVQAGKQSYDWASWAEVLEPRDGTAVLAKYTDHYYAGGVAAISRKLGRGTVTYVGVDSQEGGLEAEILRGVFEKAGTPIQKFADDFIVDWRDGLWIATNFNEKTQTAPIPVSAKLLIGTKEVPIAGVTVWKE